MNLTPAEFGAALMVRPGTGVSLSAIDTKGTPGCYEKDAGKEHLSATVSRIAALQRVLWAENRRAVLVVLQGMDTAGKDGLIRGVFSGVNPQGCKVHSFKAPTERELEHDFLWRVHQHVPPRGEIGVFNRSHYEDVVIVRVRGLVPEGVWRGRYRQINEFEKHLVENGTTVLKFFLHISKDEQRGRLQARIDDPEKRWKMSMQDLEERKLWDDYQRAYEEAIERCSTEWAPWYVIPSDRKWYRNLAAAEILRGVLEGMGLEYPKARFEPDGLVVE